LRLSADKKSRFVLICLGSIVAVCLLSAVLQLVMILSLNHCCEAYGRLDPGDAARKKTTANDIARLIRTCSPALIFEQCTRAPSLIFDGSLDIAKLEYAADDYLISYLESLASEPENKKSSLAWEEGADALVPELRFSACMRLMSDRAAFYQYVLHLPYLAETYQRCVVWQCRRALDELRRDVDLQKSADLGPAVEAEANLLLAEQINNLGDLYVAHGKYQIAERAYADAVASVESACRLDPIDYNYEVLEERYLIWSKYLARIKKEDEARNVLERMLTTFSWAG
jgi:tetratricopeptide (TPR) repeat protein